jgi:Leucine-rich repeat (LRR) protein
LLLEDKKLQQFPRSVFKIKTLKILDLSDNPIQMIPDEIVEMDQLEELYLKGCRLSELPDSIGALASLRVLDISRNNIGEQGPDGHREHGLHLPESIGKLATLRVLKMNYNKGFDRFPASIANLTGLEELEAYQCSDAAPIDFPDILCHLTGLKRLDIGSNSFTTIPESFLNLANLEELRMDASLCYLNTLPDLSRLPRLRVVHVDGLRDYITRPHPRHPCCNHSSPSPASKNSTSTGMGKIKMCSSRLRWANCASIFNTIRHASRIFFAGWVRARSNPHRFINPSGDTPHASR